MNQLYIILIAVFVALSFHQLPQEEAINELTKSLESWNASYPEEKIFIHTDKTYYNAGDTIWYKAYLVNGQTLRPDTLSTILYIEFLNEQNKVLFKRNQIVYFGGTSGDFILEEDKIQAGRYQLRAYTNFMHNQDMRYIYETDITILDGSSVSEYDDSVKSNSASQSQEPSGIPLDFPDVQLLPEGGNLVAGLTSIIGVCSREKLSGRGIDVEGKVYNQSREAVMSFKTFKRGLGQFSFQPKSGERYTAEIEYRGQTFIIPFPKMRNEGHIIRVANQKDQVQITAATNLPGGLKDVLISCQMHGVIVAHALLDGNSQEIKVTIEKNDLPSGVMQITLFDSQLRPLAERLTFIEKSSDGVNSQVSLNKDVFNHREQVELQIKIEDPGANGLYSNLSVAVTDRSVINKREDRESILTELLLNSEIKGSIEDPGYYFSNDDPKRKRLLDVLMLTQGWRRYKWNEVMSTHRHRARFHMERGFTVKGYISKYLNPKSPIQAFVSLTTLSTPFHTDDMMSGENGKFKFLDIPFIDTSDFIIQARQPSKKSAKSKDPMSGKKWNTIHLDDFSSPEVNWPSHYRFPLQNRDVMIEFLTESKRVQDINSSFSMEVQLDEVEIKSRKIKEKDPLDRSGQLYDSPNHRIVLDSIPSQGNFISIFQLIRSRVPGVQITGNYPNESVLIRGYGSILGGTEPLFILDGVPVDAGTISSIPVAQVSHIDVIKGAQAAIYGSRGSNGAIAVYTRTGGDATENIVNAGIDNFQHPGIYHWREFYAPVYDGRPESQGIGVDVRTTLHWAPVVFTDSLGQASLSFYTCDKTTDYDIDVQGITLDGRPVTDQITFKVVGN